MSPVGMRRAQRNISDKTHKGGSVRVHDTACMCASLTMLQREVAVGGKAVHVRGSADGMSGNHTAEPGG
jgi:hypothetical protein